MAHSPKDQTAALPKVSGSARWKNFGVLALATSFFVGYLPVAPGTWGSVVGAAIAWGLKDAGVVVQVLASLALLVVGAWASGEACRLYQTHDASKVVIDEVVGMMITMIAIPTNLQWLIIGFILFRIFDVVKPPPANFFDRHVKSGWGVMLDDVAAGIYGNILLHLMLRARI